MKNIYINTDIWLVYNHLIGNITIPSSLLKTTMGVYSVKHHIGYNIYMPILSEPFSLLKNNIEYYVYSDSTNDIYILYDSIKLELIKQGLMCEISRVTHHRSNSIFMGDKHLNIYTINKKHLFIS